MTIQVVVDQNYLYNVDITHDGGWKFWTNDPSDSFTYTKEYAGSNISLGNWKIINLQKQEAV